MKKLMAFDVDGTLLFNHKIEAETVNAIQRWQDAGNIAICNTGKSIYAHQIAFKNFDITFDYHILYTGAVITDRNYRILTKKTLDTGTVKTVVDYLANIDGISVFATTLDHDYRISNGTGRTSAVLPAFSPMNLKDLEKHEYVGIPIWSPDSNLRAEIFTWVLENFSDSFDCHRNLDFLDIVPKDSDKGSGLKWLVENQFGHEKVELYTIGDSWNDLDMHAYADHAASFTYSPAEVQKATEQVVDKAYEFIDWALND